jgi:hypothetical protein
MSKVECNICQEEPAFEPGDDVFLCALHLRMYSVWKCPASDRTSLTTEAPKDDERCRSCERKQRVSKFSQSTKEQLEAFKEANAVLSAMQFLMETQSPRPSLGEAKELAAIYGVVAAAIVKADLGAVLEGLESSHPKPCAIEAVWDGDSFGWFVVVSAIFNSPTGSQPAFTDLRLATFSDDIGDARLFTGEAPPWREAEQAAVWGSHVADRLGIPFWFPARDAPDDQAPRWNAS